MIAKIIVWVDKGKDGFAQDEILTYDGFTYPEVEAHDIPIERCKIDSLDNCLKVFLDTYPARIDVDPRFSILRLLSNAQLKFHPEAYTILDSDKGKGTILWTNPTTVVDK